jgi:hypothetical protein
VQSSEVVLRPGEPPQLCLVQRQKTRRFTNYERLREVALEEGFAVVDVIFEDLTAKQIVATMRMCDGVVSLSAEGELEKATPFEKLSSLEGFYWKNGVLRTCDLPLTGRYSCLKAEPDTRDYFNCIRTMEDRITEDTSSCLRIL